MEKNKQFIEEQGVIAKTLIEEQTKLAKTIDTIKDNPERAKKNNDTKNYANSIKKQDLSNVRQKIATKEKIQSKWSEKVNQINTEVDKLTGDI